MATLISYWSTRTLRREARAWVLRLASGQATEHDGEAFRAWCRQSSEHAHAALQARAVWQGLRPAAQAVLRHGADAPRASSVAEWTHPGRRAFLGGALAAGAAWLVVDPPMGWWSGWDDWRADYHTGTGERRDIALQGGVRIVLNTQTRIDLLASRSGEPLGIALLAGEAEIRTPTGIEVRAAGGRITTEAARLNVRYVGSRVCVTCLDGSISVDAGAGPARLLLAAQQLTYGPGGASTPVGAAPDDVSAWRDGILMFNNAPLADVVRELNRYRPGRIVITDESLGRRLVVARFTLDRLDEALALIHRVYGASVTRLPGGVVLLGQGGQA